MAKVALFKKIKDLSLVSFDFTMITPQTTSDGTKVAILELAEPMDKVRGSQTVELDGEVYPVTAENVVEIKVHQDAFEDNENFTWDDETQMGHYEGEDLVLDVAKRDRSVWLTTKPFSASANEFRQNAQKERYSIYAKNGQSVGSTKRTLKPAVQD